VRNGIELAARYDWARSGELLEGILTTYLADPPAFQQPVEPGYDADLVVWSRQVEHAG
jgi:hypothetical protein